MDWPVKVLLWWLMGIDVGTRGGGIGVFDRFWLDNNDGGGVGGSSILVTLMDCR